MKRWLWISAALAILIGVVLHNTSRGQFASDKRDLGPDEKGATLRLPGIDPPPSYRPANTPPVPDFVQKLGVSPLTPTRATSTKAPTFNQTEINKQFEITPDVGSWTILLIAYTGPEAPQLANKMVRELQATFKFNAYVFNYGAKEKQAEYERVQKLKEKHAEDLKKSGLQGDFVPIPIRMVHIPEQTGVLIGGFRTHEEAAGVLKQLRAIKIDQGFAKRVALDVIQVSKEVPDKERKKIVQTERVELAYNNPFLSAFVTRNPAIQQQANDGKLTADDLKLFRHINKDEPFSLLKCPKKFTLVVKRFETGTKTVGSTKEVKDFLSQWDSWKGDYEDRAALNAHKTAEGLRTLGIREVYVLHARFCSFVTVGGFDEVGREMEAMQNFLQNGFRHESMRQFDFMPRPLPMEVPR